MKVRLIGTPKEVDTLMKLIPQKFAHKDFKSYPRTPTRYTRVQKKGWITAYVDLTLLSTIARSINAMRKRE